MVSFRMSAFNRSLANIITFDAGLLLARSRQTTPNNPMTREILIDQRDSRVTRYELKVLVRQRLEGVAGGC